MRTVVGGVGTWHEKHVVEEGRVVTTALRILRRPANHTTWNTRHGILVLHVCLQKAKHMRVNGPTVTETNKEGKMVDSLLDPEAKPVPNPTVDAHVLRPPIANE